MSKFHFVSLNHFMASKPGACQDYACPCVLSTHRQTSPIATATLPPGVGLPALMQWSWGQGVWWSREQHSEDTV